MKASDIYVGACYAYSPVNNSKFQAYWNKGNYSAYTIWKVKVLQTGVQRWSDSTDKNVYNGVKVEFLGMLTTEGKNKTEVVAPNRIKKYWGKPEDDYYKAALQRVEERNAEHRLYQQQREQKVALSQYQSSVLEDNALTITDVLEANGLEPDVDFTIEKYERGVVLRGDGITKLLDILV